MEAININELLCLNARCACAKSRICLIIWSKDISVGFKSHEAERSTMRTSSDSSCIEPLKKLAQPQNKAVFGAVVQAH